LNIGELFIDSRECPHIGITRNNMSFLLHIFFLAILKTNTSPYTKQTWEDDFLKFPRWVVDLVPLEVGHENFWHFVLYHKNHSESI